MFPKNQMNVLKITYLTQDLSNPEEELLELFFVKTGNILRLTRNEFRDYDLLYNKFAKREVEYITRAIQRPTDFTIQITLKELNTIVNEYKIDDLEKEIFKVKVSLMLVDIERQRKDPNSEYYKPPIIDIENEEDKGKVKYFAAAERLVEDLMIDIERYKTNMKEGD